MSVFSGPGEGTASRCRRSWYVLHVKPRTEKKVVFYLKRYGLWHYLPLYRKERRLQRRKVVSVLPLFPGYVIALMDPAERLKVLQSNLLVRTISVTQPRKLIHQLRQISRASRADGNLRKVDVFTEGELVKVSSGPFYGIEGYVKKDTGGDVVVLNVEMLGQAVAVSISPDDCIRV